MNLNQAKIEQVEKPGTLGLCLQEVSLGKLIIQRKGFPSHTGTVLRLLAMVWLLVA